MRPGACALDQLVGGGSTFRPGGGRGWAALSYLHVACVRRRAACPAVHVGEPVHAGGKLYTEGRAATVIRLYLVHRHPGSRRTEGRG